MTWNPSTQELARKLQSPFYSKIFFLGKLPLGFFTGLRIQELTPTKSVVSVPFKWLNKNPFESMYFGVQAMAGELATGVLVTAYTKNSTSKISMLVVDFQAQFTKKATSTIYFTCLDAEAIHKGVQKTESTGEGVKIITKATGTTEDGTVVSEIVVTWSIKAKKQ